MNKIINQNSISGSNDYKKFLEGLYERLNQQTGYNKNLLYVIDQEIKQNRQAYKKSDEIKISQDQPFYSTDVVDYIFQFINHEELRQNSRQNCMCEQDEMIGYQIKQQKDFNFESILRWIMDAWLFIPEDEDIENMEAKETFELKQNHQKDDLNQKKEIDENTVIPDKINLQNLPQDNDYQKNKLQSLINKAELLEEKNKQFEEDKKNICLKFSCQILGGLDIKSFHIILQQLNKKMTNLMQDDIDYTKQNKNQQYKDINNQNVTIIQGKSQTQDDNQSSKQENKQKMYQQNSEEKLQIEKDLNQKDNKIENIDQNSSYCSNKSPYSQQNLPSQSECDEYQSSNKMIQNNAIQIDCLLQIIKCLEEDRIKNNHVDQCLLFAKNSQLRIEKLRKGTQDFQLVIGFKITFKRQIPFILLSLTTEKNQANELLMKVLVNVNQDNKNTNVQIILSEKKTEYKSYYLNLGSTELLLHKWISFQIICQPQSKEQVIYRDYQFIFLFYFKKDLKKENIQSNQGFLIKELFFKKNLLKNEKLVLLNRCYYVNTNISNDVFNV